MRVLPQKNTLYASGPVSVALAMELPDPWPTPKPTVGIEVGLSDGLFGVVFSPENRIIVQIAKEVAGSLSLIGQSTSCRLEGEAGSRFILFVEWESPELIKIRVNGKTTGFEGAELPPEFCLTLSPSPKEIPSGEVAIEDGEAARQKRSNRLAKLKMRKDQSFSGSITDYASLRRLVERVRGFISHICQGQMEFVPDLATCLRALVAEANHDLGVLQRCAAHRDASIPVYVFGGNLDRPAFFSESTVLENIALSTCIPPHTKPIDLDDWLDLRAISDPEGNLSHRDVVKIIADTLGAHSDIGVHNFVIRYGFRFPNGDLELGFLAAMVVQYARLVVEVAEGLLMKPHTQIDVD